ncbi:MAG: immunity 17 family protein [Ruminococcus sp.]|nr:immunity 17 family protein [Ruminococcus sp.]
METFGYIFFILAGIFSVLASIKNWDWYFNNCRARPFVRIFGRTGARIFYIFIGIFITGIGVLCLIKN